MDTQHELLARISDAAVRIKKHEDQLRRTKHVLHSRVAECIEDYNEIFEPLL
jgi:hypothetical protein